MTMFLPSQILDMILDEIGSILDTEIPVGSKTGVVFDYKKGHERVTKFDIMLQKRITEAAKKIDPEILVIGEESSHSEISAFVEGSLPNDQIILVDPLDGTSNVTLNLPIYSSIITYIQNGEVRAVRIYDSLEKSFIGEGDVKRTTRDDRSSSSDISLIASPSRLPGNLKIDALKGYRCIYNLRCTGYEYLMLLRGQAEVGIFPKASVWEHLGGRFLCLEAGLIHQTLNGDQYTRASHGKTVLVAQSTDILNNLIEKITC